MIGYGNADKIMQDVALDEFKQQFNPAQFYRKIRHMGFEKDNAKRVTRRYAETYESMLQIFDYRYKLK